MTRVVLRPLKAAVTAHVDWPELIHQLLPDALPRRHELCKAVLKSIFQRDLPEGILQAVSTLVVLECEGEARALLIDFFRERRGANRIGKRLEMKRIFQKRRDAMSGMPPSTPMVPPVEVPVDEVEEQDDAVGFEWAPSVEEALPPSDDMELRNLAGDAQLKASETGAGYAVGYESEAIPEWDTGGWVNTVTTDPGGSAPHSEQSGFDLESQLLDRLAALGNDGIALLRYFHTNPGDGARHAADMLDYQFLDVNKQLNNKLKGYVRRHESGWACVEWVARIFELMPK